MPVLVYLVMKSNKYLRRLIATYSEPEKKYSIIKILKDLETKGKESLWGIKITKEAADRLRARGLKPYDRANIEALHQAVLDIFYEKTDLLKILDDLNLNRNKVDDEVLNEAREVIRRQWKFINEILKGRDDGRISKVVAENITRELAQWRRVYSSSSASLITRLGAAIALIVARVLAEASGPQKSPAPEPSSKPDIEWVAHDGSGKHVDETILDEFRKKVDITKLEDGFNRFYNSLNIDGVPRGDKLLSLLYERAVFYTQHSTAFDNKFGHHKAIVSTLSSQRDKKPDAYIATVRDLFVASVSGGALEKTWEIMRHQEFTKDEIATITTLLATHEYKVEFLDPEYGTPTHQFSNEIIVKISDNNKPLAEIHLRIEGLETFNFYNLSNQQFKKALSNYFVTSVIQSDVSDMYNFYMILPNGIESPSNKVHYIGIVFKVQVKAYKVGAGTNADSGSTTVGMAKLKNKHSKTFGRRKKYSWM